MSEHVFDEDILETLASAPRRLCASVSAESYRSSSESVATSVHYVVKNRSFTIDVESVGHTRANVEKNLRWVPTLVRFDSESASHDQASSKAEDIQIDSGNYLQLLKSLQPVVHENSKPTVKSMKSDCIATLDIKSQARLCVTLTLFLCLSIVTGISFSPPALGPYLLVQKQYSCSPAKWDTDSGCLYTPQRVTVAPYRAGGFSPSRSRYEFSRGILKRNPALIALMRIGCI